MGNRRMREIVPDPLELGERVAKYGGDYWYEGVVVASFLKRDGVARRYVVEDNRGLLFIFSRDNLRRL